MRKNTRLISQNWAEKTSPNGGVAEDEVTVAAKNPAKSYTIVTTKKMAQCRQHTSRRLWWEVRKGALHEVGSHLLAVDDAGATVGVAARRARTARRGR
ncbi:hypothetical protein E2562_036463 [Oryza meyeriana var. granulata]|uniref:Uncharacterized protein n=1 Tax=Oryza meyeriana var. granulata TaxID=110450 RepID=A0A6G1ET72_9ORYZ|nr:hypothetical protein E2562_036463 [Oryza meyeriana var. granulata]